MKNMMNKYRIRFLGDDFSDWRILLDEVMRVIYTEHTEKNVIETVDNIKSCIVCDKM